MRDKFITSNFELDLSGLRTNFTEENPRFKDSLWTKYTLPVDINYDRNFLSKIGQYSSFSNANLHQKHEGYHIFEGKMLRAKLEFLEFRNKTAKIQIDSGFEELPNFEKKLSELPLEVKTVNDIYEHANEIVVLKYPDTNYNFPKLYTDEFDLESEGYKYFDSFINNRVQKTKGVWDFPRNEVKETNEFWDCINRNIIHPVPYLLYVLVQGFKDAGFILAGEILEDKNFIQRGIFSDKHYFTTGEQKEHKANIFERDYYDHENGAFDTEIAAKWQKKFKIDAPGKYRMIIKCSCENNNGQGSLLEVSKNGKTIESINNSEGKPGKKRDNINANFVFEIDISEAEIKQEILVDFYGAIAKDTIEEKKNIGVAQIEIRPIRQHTVDGAAVPFIFNSNKVDLKRAVPDMTFGELVNTIKNWGNYDLIFENNIVTMNRIKIDKTQEPEDFREFEVEDPVRSKTQKQAFLLKFPEVEELDLDSIFFNDKGYSLNPVNTPTDTTEININGFCLPIETFRGTSTAKVFKENALMLVYYNGLDANGNNHASNPQGLHGKLFAESVKDWYINRLTNFTYKWTFVAHRSKLRKFNIRSEIFAYNKKHWIKSWVKNSISENYYSVEIETETY